MNDVFVHFVIENKKPLSFSICTESMNPWNWFSMLPEWKIYNIW